jgi:hypothetical protein
MNVQQQFVVVYESSGFWPLTKVIAIAVKRIPAPYTPVNPIETCLFASRKAVQSYIPAVIAVKFPIAIEFPVELAGIVPPSPTENGFVQNTSVRTTHQLG